MVKIADIEIQNQKSKIENRFYGPGIDEPICMIDVEHSNAVYYYHFDGLGSVVALSDSSHNIVEKYSYDVFGGVTIRDPLNAIRSSSAYGNPYMFTGRAYDSETGNYYYRADAC